MLRLQHIIIFFCIYTSVILSLSIALRKTQCRSRKGMLLLVFSCYEQGNQGTRGWMELQGEASEMTALFLALCEHPCTSGPAAFLRYALQVRSILIKMILPDVLVCLLAKLHGEFVIRQLPKWSLQYNFSDLREVLFIHRGNFTQNTVWSWMKLRGTGRNVALRQKDFQCLSLKAISDFSVPSRQLQRPQ